jgi:hypothetical protein
MNHRTLGGLLLAAQEHVALGEKRILRQRAIVAELELQRFDTCEARNLLALFEDLQELHVANANRLRMAIDDRSD